MGVMADDWYRERAKQLYGRPRTDLAVPAAEVQEHARPERDAGPASPGVYKEEKPTVSKGTNPGAWVMLWVWVPDPPEEANGEATTPDQGPGGP